MGSVAETAVIPYLRHEDSGTRSEACKVLKDIGGPESVAALEVVMRTDPDRGVQSEAHRALVVLASSESGFRTWTEKTTQRTIEAQFLEVKDGKAYLKKKDGSTTSVSVSKLSDEDQFYIRNEQKRRRFLGM
jgi:hypothetical protein